MAKKWKDLVNKMPNERQARIKEGAAHLRAEMLALRDLRQSLNLTQEQLAQVMEITQHSISKMESQEDMHISTLKRYIQAIGGKLKIVAEVKGKDYMIAQFDE